MSDKSEEADYKLIRATWWCDKCCVIVKRGERCPHCGKTKRDKS
jgi:rubrerythrin